MPRKRRWPGAGEDLGPGEFDVLLGAADGESCEETAARRGVTLETIKTQRRKAIAKLGARNTTNAVALAYDHGLFRPRRRR